MMTFVDTNVLVYARDASEPEKQPRARQWMEHLWAARRGCLSTQVLSEYYVTVTRKLKPGLSRAIAQDDVRDLTAWNPLPVSEALMVAAWRIEAQNEISYWDALVVAAAQACGADQLLSEDLQDGQRFGRVTVLNPFTRDPTG